MGIFFLAYYILPVYAADFGLFGAPLPEGAPSYTSPYSSPSGGGNGGGGGSGDSGGGGGGGGTQDTEPRGLLATYFDNDNFTGATVSAIDPFINFNWAFRAPHSFMGKDTFSVIWNGEILPPQSGLYTFYAGTDDGVRVWINGQLIINRWKVKSAYEVTGKINLTGGQRYRIMVEYFEKYNRASAILKWSALSKVTKTVITLRGRKLTTTRNLLVVPKQVIPSSQLFPN